MITMHSEESHSMEKVGKSENINDYKVIFDNTKSDTCSLFNLPNDIILDIIGYCNQKALSRTNSIMYQLSNEVERRTFYIHFGNIGFNIVKTVNDLCQSCRVLMTGEDSLVIPIHWRSWTKLLSYDWCFFGPNNITNINEGDITLADGPNDPSLNHGIWRLVSGNPWGDCLHASNVQCLGLRYGTVLSPGKYTVNLNVRVANIVSLMPIRFRIDGTKYVEPLASEFMPYTVLPESGLELQNYLDMMPIELCLGTIEVNYTEQGTWPLVTFNIEDSGHMINRKILFNFLYFELVTHEQIPTCHSGSGWFLRQNRFKPTKNHKDAYDDLRQIKMSIMRDEN